MTNNTNYQHVLQKLWQTWALCFGAVTALGMAGWFIPHIWMPFVALGLLAPVFAFANRNMSTGQPNCSLLSHYTIYILALSGTIMLVLNMLNTKYFVYEFSNPDIPFVSTVVVFPVAAVFYSVALWHRHKTSYCKECQERVGYTIKEMLEAGVFREQAKFLTRLALRLSAIITAVTIIYACLYYIDANINSPDTFFFFIVPGVVYALSLAYVSMRFSSLHFEISMSNSHNDSRFGSVARFIVVSGDCIRLKEITADDQPLGTWDVAVACSTAFTNDMSDAEARELFSKATGIADFALRPLFRTSTSAHNAFHFAVFLPQCEDDDAKLEGEWFNLYQIDAMLKSGMICRPFAYEINRIYRMTMAWKTYDRQGNRLYPIKNYKPTFRITDFKDWDLDYNDLHWLNVSNNNADRPFFKIRRFWRRYVTGSDNKWKRSNS